MGIRYKVVPLPTAVKLKKADKGEAVAQFLENVMNEQARDGWVFVQVETLQAMEPSGCAVSKDFEMVNQVLAVFNKHVDETQKKPRVDNDQPPPRLNRGI